MSYELTAAVALLAAAVLWYIFLRGGNGGCTTHHYGDPELGYLPLDGSNAWKLRVRRGTAGYYVDTKMEENCQHEGCDASKENWQNVKQFNYKRNLPDFLQVDQ